MGHWKRLKNNMIVRLPCWRVIMKNSWITWTKLIRDGSWNSPKNFQPGDLFQPVDLLIQKLNSRFNGYALLKHYHCPGPLWQCYQNHMGNWNLCWLTRSVWLAIIPRLSRLYKSPSYLSCPNINKPLLHKLQKILHKDPKISWTAQIHPCPT